MYEDMVPKFAEHFSIWIARAMNQTGPEGTKRGRGSIATTSCVSPMAARDGRRSIHGRPLAFMCYHRGIEPWQRERCQE